MKGHDAGRRAFFRGGLKKAIQGLHGIVEESFPEAERPSTPTQVSNIVADLSPELLAMEAERLGLDPADKDAIARALEAEMQAAAG
ncbi:hypothetical protein [Desulfoplanes sp.]